MRRSNMKKPNHFQARIAKEEVNDMPLASFKGNVYVVNTEEKAEKALNYLEQQEVLGIDTETKPAFNRGEHHPTALLQIATRERCYLFQLLQIGFTPRMANLFANPDICKVGLAFKDDLAGLKRLSPFVPANCVDLQKIVLSYGILDLGLQKMFAIIFGRKISKAQQLTNWEQTVLTKEQAGYAATDAWATLLIYQELLKTKKLPRKEYMALREADLQLQRLHQQEMQEKRLLAIAQNINDEYNLS